MSNKRADQLPRLTSYTGDELFVTGDPVTGELFAGNIGLLIGGTNKNESIPFTAVAQLTIPWDFARKAKYGASGRFYVEIVNEDGVIRNATVEIIPDSLTNTTSYHFDFGGVSTGRITIS